MRKVFLVFTVCLFSFSAFSQSWDLINDKSQIPELGIRAINPDQFLLAKIDDSEIKSILWSAPDELLFDPKRDKHVVLNVLLADGTEDKFSIVRYQMMEPQLAAKFDEIRTFHGISASNPARRIRISYSVYGIRANITDEFGQTYIDHFQRNDREHKIIYRRSDLRSNEDWECEFKNEKNANNNELDINRFSGDCLFRSYRLAMTTTGEYSNYHGATSVADSMLVMSAVVVTVDRVNDVFEQDLTMRLILIDNATDIFYYNPNTDPFTGNDAEAMIGQNQTNTNAVIGSANYDLGHIISTGGSGLASLGVICSNNSKARGVTGISVPEGDPFDIDYVAHELGHQLGANHTQNNSCQRNNATAMEPGSASTIMGYAGICSPNVQSNSDAYFHAISIQEMNAEITSNSCHGVITISNVGPIANPLTDKTIPHSTPFVLDIVATDADGDVLTYNWEQMDNEVGTMPPQGTNTVGPMFRSIFATTDSTRYFPNIATIASNGTFQWEVLPTVARNMDFRVTVRDNTFAPGCTDEQNITITVNGGSGPFLVTSQNTASTWTESENVTITWDVANTNSAPVSCDNVDILLSYDSGLTYETILISGTPNDGSQSIVVPFGVSNTARFMVKCSDNVFFDINDTDINIESGAPTYTINTNPNFDSVCNNDSISFILESTSISGYMDPIILSVADLPVGAIATIATNPIIPGNNTLITINNLQNQSGISNISVTGVSGTIIRETEYLLTIFSPTVAPILNSPSDNSTGLAVGPTLEWKEAAEAISYEYQVSNQSNGGNVINAGITQNTSVIIAPNLSISADYYWRVRSINICGASAWSEEWTFNTKACISNFAEDLPINISASGTVTITSDLQLQDKGIITDLNVVQLIGNHTYIADLNFTLIAPDNTQLTFWSDPCSFQNDFNINFDDEAPNNNWPCPPIDGGFYQPDNALSFFDSKQMQGEWTLSVFDDANLDGGALTSWGLEICMDNYCDLTVIDAQYNNDFGTLLSALDCAVDGDTIFLELPQANATINIGSGSIVLDKDLIIKANTGDNIRILSNGNVPTFIVNAGKFISLIGIDIENDISVNGVIQNNGNLKLIDADIIVGQGNDSVINQGAAILSILGNCTVIEE